MHVRGSPPVSPDHLECFPPRGQGGHRDTERQPGFTVPVLKTTKWKRTVFGSLPFEWGTSKQLKPRSNVIPRSRLAGCLSNDAVDNVVLRARTMLVFPLSTWPITPIFKFLIVFMFFLGGGFLIRGTKTTHTPNGNHHRNPPPLTRLLLSTSPTQLARAARPHRVLHQQGILFHQKAGSFDWQKHCSEKLPSPDCYYLFRQCRRRQDQVRGRTGPRCGLSFSRKDHEEFRWRRRRTKRRLIS